MTDLFPLHEGGYEHLAIDPESVPWRGFPSVYKTGSSSNGDGDTPSEESAQNEDNGEGQDGEYNPGGSGLSGGGSDQGGQDGGDGEYAPPDQGSSQQGTPSKDQAVDAVMAYFNGEMSKEAAVAIVNRYMGRGGYGGSGAGTAPQEASRDEYRGGGSYSGGGLSTAELEQRKREEEHREQELRIEIERRERATLEDPGRVEAEDVDVFLATEEDGKQDRVPKPGSVSFMDELLGYGSGLPEHDGQRPIVSKPSGSHDPAGGAAAKDVLEEGLAGEERRSGYIDGRQGVELRQQESLDQGSLVEALPGEDDPAGGVAAKDALEEYLAEEGGLGGLLERRRGGMEQLDRQGGQEEEFLEAEPSGEPAEPEAMARAKALFEAYQEDIEGEPSLRQAPIITPETEGRSGIERAVVTTETQAGIVLQAATTEEEGDVEEETTPVEGLDSGSADTSSSPTETTPAATLGGYEINPEDIEVRPVGDQFFRTGSDVIDSRLSSAHQKVERGDYWVDASDYYERGDYRLMHGSTEISAEDLPEGYEFVPESGYSDSPGSIRMTEEKKQERIEAYNKMAQDLGIPLYHEAQPINMWHYAARGGLQGIGFETPEQERQRILGESLGATGDYEQQVEDDGDVVWVSKEPEEASDPGQPEETREGSGELGAVGAPAGPESGTASSFTEERINRDFAEINAPLPEDASPEDYEARAQLIMELAAAYGESGITDRETGQPISESLQAAAAEYKENASLTRQVRQDFAEINTPMPDGAAPLEYRARAERIMELAETYEEYGLTDKETGQPISDSLRATAAEYQEIADGFLSGEYAFGGEANVDPMALRGAAVTSEESAALFRERQLWPVLQDAGYTDGQINAMPPEQREEVVQSIVGHQQEAYDGWVEDQSPGSQLRGPGGAGPGRHGSPGRRQAPGRCSGSQPPTDRVPGFPRVFRRGPGRDDSPRAGRPVPDRD